uniref:Abnormal spindle-like microcephaly-associated protein ASH domain-containing protein n=1 Tax=Latimeria chalumnae TaxID=7897 RepID=H3AN97_LATCH
VSQPGSALESASSCHSLDAEVAPFSVEPCSGVILPGKKEEFLVKFSPLEVGEFEGHLICSITNLKEEEQGPVLALKGRSLLPFCHFELEDSDYLSGNKRNPELRGPRGAPPGITLDPNTRVIEFSSIGVFTRNSRIFSIINPTTSNYSFNWICESTVSLREEPVFRCLTERGIVKAGKKAEVMFEFIPQQLDVAESFWTFLIPEQNISIPFLLVGKTREPAINFNRPYLNYRSILIGQEAQETIYIINNEDQPFSFMFRENSRHSAGHVSSLTVHPIEGTVSPCSRVPVVISFSANCEGEVNFNLICDVKKKTQPLALNVKAEGYAMKACVRCELGENQIMELSSQTVNRISFKEVEVNECVVYRFMISNNGKFSFGFVWEYSFPRDLQQHLKMSPESGRVMAAQKTKSALTFFPQKKCSFKDLSLKQLHVYFPPMYLLCTLVWRIMSSYICKNLAICTCLSSTSDPPRGCFRFFFFIRSKPTAIHSVDCLFTSTAYLDVVFHSEVLYPKGNIQVPITFYPREAIQYHEVITFEFNRLSKQNVDIFGQGSEMKVEVANPENRTVSFGALRIRQIVKKVVPVVNHSLAPLTFSLAITSNVPALQDPKVLNLLPSGEITLQPNGGTCNVEVIFSPKCRMIQFAEEVMLDCAGMSRPLFLLTGCCQGIEICLDQNHISFGAVVLGSQALRRVVMQNSGDVGVSFKWEIQKFKPNSSIEPVEGYVSPSMEVVFDVTFHPTEMNQDIRCENLNCSIEGSQPLQLTLSGSCVGCPSSKDIINFSCQVRNKHTQVIMLMNRSNQYWNLRPIYEGEHWNGPESVIVEPHQQNKPYEIT